MPRRVRLVSDRQPNGLRIDEHPFGPPAIWLHSDPVDVAWIIVDIGQQDWSQLACQFGHELGHVMANSWRRDAKPATSCQWPEEAMVEAFSIRGPALWPFAGSRIHRLPATARSATRSPPTGMRTPHSPSKDGRPCGRPMERAGGVGDPALQGEFPANRERNREFLDFPARYMKTSENFPVILLCCAKIP